MGGILERRGKGGAEGALRLVRSSQDSGMKASRSMIGVPGEKWGEAVKSCVQLESGSKRRLRPAHRQHVFILNPPC
jgi:hypothetical protein